VRLSLAWPISASGCSRSTEWCGWPPGSTRPTLWPAKTKTLEVTIENTMGLRLFTGSIFDVAWDRLANASGKYAGLQEAVEQAFTDTIGNEVRPWTDDLADDVVELFDALAWAGAKGE
jgi:hypothetical protein